MQSVVGSQQSEVNSRRVLIVETTCMASPEKTEAKAGSPDSEVGSQQPKAAEQSERQKSLIKENHQLVNQW